MFQDGVRACDVVQTMETSSPQAQFDTQLLQYQVGSPDILYSIGMA